MELDIKIILIAILNQRFYNNGELPFPNRVPWGGFPCFLGTMGRSDSLRPSPRASFPSPSDTVQHLLVRSPIGADASRGGSPGGLTRFPHSALRRRRLQGLPGSWGTLTCMPCSQTPADQSSWCCLKNCDGAFRFIDSVGSANLTISGLYHTAYRLPVYASRLGLPLAAQHSVPAASTLGRSGLSPAGSQ